MSLPPLSLYVHLPWCVKKCPYCDFNSHAKTEIPEARYLQSLMNDLSLDLPLAQSRPVESIFFGGGTPSLMSGGFYRELMSKLSGRLAIADNVEITLEANPGTTDAAHFKAYAQAGINRISLGGQSFNDRHLKALGRIHEADQIVRSVDSIHGAGIDNFNIDLMHGLPDQTLDEAMADLQQAFSLNPTHVSWYQLTIEPNTEFYNTPPVLPEEDALWSIVEEGVETLAQAGYRRYEVSAYAKPGRESRHNLNYWQFGDYIGIGAGAHSKITLDNGDIIRYRKSRIPDAYMADRIQYRVGEKAIEKAEQSFEFMMNVLRLTNGVSEAILTDRTALQLSDVAQELAKLRSEGLMEHDRIQLTPRGQLFLNSVLERFL